jgi:hypothetical protein
MITILFTLKNRFSINSFSKILSCFIVATIFLLVYSQNTIAATYDWLGQTSTTVQNRGESGLFVLGKDGILYASQSTAGDYADE